ncbi:metal-dependent transcriptional regulator [Periweissella cryptocerci]|uniref:Manganese transport regulator n=1 Tax=Periweissella cryptocerci TaxID=2506420 RepID=A0A4P6YV98_9LACO|nr:metal-dependent transcriptional regulator [Periweissella cryptocerci]QBO36681.1 metal-dependent transcriptional regulator [Periweissella cryptocerci]
MPESMSKTQYLQTILELGGSNEKISNKAIAEHLKVTPSSVSDMLAKLQESGDVEVQPYYGVTLTASGRKTALKLIRSHRLFEVFLHDKLGLSLAESHMNADNLDHDADEKMINSLDTFLGTPRYCPHGLLIPDEHYNYKPTILQTLAATKDGAVITINSYSEDFELLEYIEMIHLDIAQTWLVKGRLPFDGPIILINQDDQTEVQVSLKSANFIFVN